MYYPRHHRIVENECFVSSNTTKACHATHRLTELSVICSVDNIPFVLYEKEGEFVNITRPLTVRLMKSADLLHNLPITMSTLRTTPTTVGLALMSAPLGDSKTKCGQIATINRVHGNRTRMHGFCASWEQLCEQLVLGVLRKIQNRPTVLA